MEVGSWKNWSHTAVFHGRVVRPQCTEEISSCVKSAKRVHVLGAGHSCLHPTGPITDVASADSGLVLLDLTETMSSVLLISKDRDGWFADAEAGCSFEKLATELRKQGLAMQSAPSQMCMTLAGGILTGSHGSGLNTHSLAGMVKDMTVVTGSGEVQVLTDPYLFIHLGLLGVVTKLRFRCVPFFYVQQRVYQHVPLTSFSRQWYHCASEAQSFRFVIDLQEGTFTASMYDPLNEAAEGMLATPLKHLEAGITSLTTATQSWSEIVPCCGIQESLEKRTSARSEFFISLSELPRAVHSLLAIPNFKDVLQQGFEIHVMQSDFFALSPCHQRFAQTETCFACITVGFTHDPERTPFIVTVIERTLRPFAARPQWDTLFNLNGRLVERLYGKEVHPDCGLFWRTVCELDPLAKFRNGLFEQIAHKQIFSGDGDQQSPDDVRPRSQMLCNQPPSGLSIPPGVSDISQAGDGIITISVIAAMVACAVGVYLQVRRQR